MQGEDEKALRGDDAETGGSAPDHVRVLRNISRAIVELYKVQFGRGPETVSSRFAGPDTLITLLGNTLTPVERTMRDMGEQQRLRDIRMMFQYATEEKFRAIVEEMTGRQVVAFMSGIDVLRDVSCEVFTLLPAPEAP